MHDFTILVLPGSYAASVAITLDMLKAAELLAPGLQLPRPVWRVVSPDGGTVPLSNGLSVETAPIPVSPSSDTSVWIVPGLGIEYGADIEGRLASPAVARAVACLKQHVAAEGMVAASCSAVFLLQKAGVLGGRRATTAWWLASALRRLQPDGRIDADQMVVCDGQVTTAGAAFGQSDLMLHLLRIRFSPGLAEAVGKFLLIDGRQAQSRFVMPSMLSNGNELIARLTEYIESSLPQPPSVSTMAKAFAMSPRTLSRHVQTATGKGPLALVQAVRLNRARRLIENSRMPMDQVAEAVGYRDATALRRLMRQMFGTNPSAFRSGAG